MVARPEITAPERPVPLPQPARGGLAFENVSFRYPTRPDEKALNELKAEGVDVEGKAFTPLTVTLQKGGA